MLIWQASAYFCRVLAGSLANTSGTEMPMKLPFPYACRHGQAGFIITAAEHMVVQRRVFAFFDNFARSLRLGIRFAHRHFQWRKLNPANRCWWPLRSGRHVRVDDFAVAVVANAVVLRDVVNLHSDSLYCFQKHETC